MKRTILGFVLAPLWIVAAGALYTSSFGTKPDFMTNLDQTSWVMIGVTLAACAGYGTMLVLGLPAHGLLRTSGHTKGRDYVLTFMVIGALAWASVFLVGGLFFDSMEYAFRLRQFADTLVHRPHVPAVAALLGGLMGGTFWLVARPDLRRRPAP